MANEQKLPEGLRAFAPHANAPDFVKAAIVITPNALIQFCKDNADLMTDYNGNKQLRVQLLESKQGNLYFAVDTYKPGEKPAAKPQAKPAASIIEAEDDLPF